MASAARLLIASGRAPYLAAIVTLAIAALYWVYVRDRKSTGQRRRELFAECLDLFDSYRLVQDGLAFAVLYGSYRGHSVVLEPVVDHVAFRKVPSLWLKVTLREPVRYAGTFDLLMRPRGAEFYSPFGELEYELPMPTDWPRDAIVRGDDPARMPPFEVIAPHVGYFADQRMKELLVTPRGVRFVYQVSQAERTHYVVLRQLEFPAERVPVSLVRRLLDAAVDLHQSVAVAA